MRTLLVDIETAPNKAYVWGLWQQNVATNQLEASSYVLCWAAKWLGDKRTAFHSVRGKGGARGMLMAIRAMLDEADAVVHYNGQKFDIPTLNKEFVRHTLPPPSPYAQIDLMRVCKRAFRFESNRLDYVTQALGLGAKVKHEGFELWVKCMAGEAKAWRTMEEYNRGDVDLLAVLYQRLLPWIAKHPNRSALGDVSCCPRCGATDFQRRGEVLTTTRRYARFACKSCGGWFRGSVTTTPKGQRPMVAA